MEDSLRASVQGLELVDQARKRKGWNRQSGAWAQVALTSVATLKQFWRRERISRDTFIRICQVVGLTDWQEIADNQTVQQTIIDWGEAPEPALFYGRDQDLETLSQWILLDRCKLVALLGMGGMGKTTLAVKMVQQLTDPSQPNSDSQPFEFVIWRSLRNAPSLDALLTDLMRVFSDSPPSIQLSEETTNPKQLDVYALSNSETPTPLLSNLITHLREHRCLVVLDNAESILVNHDDFG